MDVRSWDAAHEHSILVVALYVRTAPYMMVFVLFAIHRCALLELWSEGTAPFEFSQLLAYRSGDMELVTAHMAQLENDNLRNLISSMISLNPKERKSAEIYLDEERGR